MADLGSTRVFGRISVSHEAFFKDDVSVDGTLSADTFVGNGGGLTNISAGNLNGSVGYGNLPFSSTNVSNWNTAFGWGNHASAGYALASRTITAGTGLTGGGNLTANRTLSVSYGTTAGTAAQGNDSRLSNSREWTAGTVSQAEAEAGTATTRRAWTAQRVAQAISALGLSIGTTATTAKAGNWMPTWANVTGKPTTFTPTAHTHSLSQITGAGSVASLNTNGSTANFLRGDGTWVTPPNTNTVTSVRANNTGTYRTGNINLIGGSNVTVSEGTAGQFTITATNTNTTYSAGAGLSLSGTTFTNTAPHVPTNLGSSGTGATRTITSSTGSNTSITYSAADVGAVPTGRTITAGTGLTGGGNLTANRTLSVDSTVVRTSGNQTINGIKTFQDSGATILRLFRDSTTSNVGIEFGNSTSSTYHFGLSVDAGFFGVSSDANVGNSTIRLYPTNGTIQATSFIGSGSGLTNLTGTYSSLRAQATTKADVGLSNVPNWSGSTSTSLGTSNTVIPSQGAVKSYVDSGLSGKANTSGTYSGLRAQATTAADVGAPPTSRTISAGTGLTGGGSLAGNRTISLDSTSQTHLSRGNTAHGWGNHASAGYATESYVDTEIDNIEIGGRNLLKDSGVTVTNGTYSIARYDLTDDIKAGEEVTLRVWGSLAATKSHFAAYNSGGSVSVTTLTDNGDGTYSRTFKWNIGSSSNTYLQLYAFTNSQTGTSTINRVKLERGNIATDWSPAPEDYTPTSRTITAGTGLSGGGNLTANRTLSVNYGTAAGTAAQGNDSRLSNSREWTASTVSQAEAQAGTATTRRAWTAQRVSQAISALGLKIGTTASTAKAGNWMPTWANVTGKPTTFTPASHTHTLAQITNAGSVAALNTNGSTANFLRGDGTWVTPPNTNTTYSEITTSEIATGTASTLRTITARRLKYAVDTHGLKIGTTATTAKAGNWTPTAADVGAVPTGRTITAGDHLLGGGNLTANRTLSLRPKVQTWILDSEGNQRLYFGNSGNTTNGMLFQLSSSGAFRFRNSANGDRFTITSGGAVTAVSNITAYSDRRIKKNIKKIDFALDKVKSLSGYTFDRTDQETPRQTGVIAQEVQKVLPEVVIENEDGTLSVAYGNMVGLLIEAIKEQQKQIDALKPWYKKLYEWVKEKF